MFINEMFCEQFRHAFSPRRDRRSLPENLGSTSKSSKTASAQFPWFPLGLLMKDKYNTIENLKEYQGRIAVIAAERDNVIRMTHAASLYQSLTGCKAMWVIDGAGHNDWPMHVNDTWWCSNYFRYA